MITFTLAIVFLCGMVWDDVEKRYAEISSSNLESDSAVLPIASADLSADKIFTGAVTETDIQVNVGESC
ncbi:MAG TPA: hypothetical protein VEI95_12295, partial [Acidobacteriota bacterium]|nr:hypothetical protein [Acidobacteriota bacterium]